MNRILRSLAVLTLALTLTACKTVNQFREAQDLFNRAATAENAARFDPTRPLENGGTETVVNAQAARSGYAQALVLLRPLTTTDAAALQRDELLGSALTLQALCEWRLGNFNQALATARSAQEHANEQLFPRDRALLAALPGLIKTDQGYNAILARKPLKDVEALLVGPKGAVADLQSAREIADRDHPIQVFLIQSQLAAYRNFMVAQSRLAQGATVPADHPARVQANAELKELQRLALQSSAGPALVQYWAKLCALDLP